jgi:hypothetical protein
MLAREIAVLRRAGLAPDDRALAALSDYGRWLLAPYRRQARVPAGLTWPPGAAR